MLRRSRFISSNRGFPNCIRPAARVNRHSDEFFDVSSRRRGETGETVAALQNGNDATARVPAILQHDSRQFLELESARRKRPSGSPSLESKPAEISTRSGRNFSAAGINLFLKTPRQQFAPRARRKGTVQRCVAPFLRRSPARDPYRDTTDIGAD